MPVVLNGRIMQPDETDEWTLQLNEKQAITLDLPPRHWAVSMPASAFMTPKANSSPPTTTAPPVNPTPCTFTAPKAGAYTVRVRDRCSVP